MSIIFGIRKSEGQSVDEGHLCNRARGTDRYAPDGTFVYANGRIGMGFQPYHTHHRSNLEKQPARDQGCNLVVFDGRLDNHKELRIGLHIQEVDAADSRIVLSAFERWGEDCFSRFIGDWALALWIQADRCLYLARDHAGTRTLYFEQIDGSILWSTYLETFFVEGIPHKIDEEFASSYLACQPTGNLTPYKGIRAVPPAHYLKFHEGCCVSRTHWQCMVNDDLRYGTDREYEEHFLSLFKQSVERRSGTGAPVLAQLSGGMDSTSVVCMSDHIRNTSDRSIPLLDTLSFYDDSEPNWNERPFFSLVEAERGKVGVHIERSFAHRSFEPLNPSKAVYLLPGPDSSAIEYEQRVDDAIRDRGYRAILSGIGGDEVLGGVPTPYPELADYLVSADLELLFRRAVEWCIARKQPITHLLFKTARLIPDLYRSRKRIDRQALPPWIPSSLQDVFIQFQKKSKVDLSRAGLKPSNISNGLAWTAILETLPSLYPESTSRYEYRYPYLDRDLVDYLFRIPREQLVRPGRRRSLMRRALRDLVPQEILERRRKASISRGPLASMRDRRATIERLLSNSLCASYGFIEPRNLQSFMNSAIQENDPKWIPSLIRAVTLEIWIRDCSKLLTPLPLADIVLPPARWSEQDPHLPGSS
jgi:asparagine synthase (glutamine-hydrolysing)